MEVQVSCTYNLHDLDPNIFIYQTIILILYDLIIFSGETCRARLTCTTYIQIFLFIKRSYLYYMI